MSGNGARRAGGRVARTAKTTAERVESSKTYSVLVRGGLIVYGLIHLLVAWLAIRLAFGENSEASNTGAIRELTKAPGGTILVAAIGIGLLALVVWQLVAALVGYREFDGGKRLRKRLAALAKAVVYGVLGGAALQAAFGGSGGGESAEEGAARGLFALPGGVLIVGLLGAGIIAYGVKNIYTGVKDKFNEEIDTSLTGWQRWLAKVGYAAKGIAYGILGGLFIAAAIRFDPEQAGGMDQALHALREQPYGQVLLVLLALGIGCFGLWCFVYSKYAKHR